MGELKGGLPVLLVGDFNAAAGENKVYDRLVGEKAFADTWVTAKRRGEPVGTFHNYKGPKKGGRRIDWILSRGAVTALSTEVVTFSQDGQYPSDHFPVVARVQIGEAKP
jgi:endonuclease/exonuclease/phosphatase family metal-dependent hydrolase